MDLDFGCAGESDAPPDRRGPGAAHDEWRLRAPPAVESIGQPAACVQQRIGVLITVASKPASADAVVHSERVEVGLVGEVKRQGHIAEPDEPQGAVGLGDGASWETFAGGDRRAASGIADADAA
ncbi:MAG: hypothetical protein BMS9Abin37_0327 [Acidobacteriota bacterium]|nr:MAG: hypothetical protein BMS9Abin37_0327 [Acidobacteriota bacterium]